MREADSVEVLRARCCCGKTWERRADASNLPRENNIGILNGAIGAHEFTHDWKDEQYDISRGWSE